MTMRLPRSSRLTDGHEFHAVRQTGKSKAGRHVVLGVLKDSRDVGFRFGFITSKRVGNAVARNLVRRRLRAIVRSLGEELQGGGKLVTIARQSAAVASYAELTEDWRRTAFRLGILPRPQMEEQV